MPLKYLVDFVEFHRKTIAKSSRVSPSSPRTLYEHNKPVFQGVRGLVENLDLSEGKGLTFENGRIWIEFIKELESKKSNEHIAQRFKETLDKLRELEFERGEVRNAGLRRTLPKLTPQQKTKAFEDYAAKQRAFVEKRQTFDNQKHVILETLRQLESEYGQQQQA